MKKHRHGKKLIQTALPIFLFGLCMVLPWIQAAAAEPGAGTASVGNIVYKDGKRSAAIYAEDIALLGEQLCGVRAKTYNPAAYGHVHRWAFTDITESTHTEHCTQCGSDMINAHTQAASEKCVIAYDGEDYLGYRYVCDCGYDWLRERYHTPVYTPIDATFHAVSCALLGTAYCDGMGETVSEHISLPHPTDETHHRAICEYCNYEGAEQACVFHLEGTEEEADTAQAYRYCECGNRQPVAGETPEATEETPPEPPGEEEKTEETPSGLPGAEGETGEPPSKLPEEGETGEPPSKLPEEGETGEPPSGPPNEEGEAGEPPSGPSNEEGEVKEPPSEQPKDEGAAQNASSKPAENENEGGNK